MVPFPFVPPIDPVQQAIDGLRAELLGLFEVEQIDSSGRGRTITFAGRLLYDADSSYDEIQRRFRAYGYTPMLTQARGLDVVLAMRGVIDQARPGNPLLNLLLFLATILTTLSAGATLAGESDVLAVIRAGDPAGIWAAILAGAPFTIALLGILGVHEFGHYFAARWHGVVATLPYFIPMPLGGLGTLGAFIAVKSPMKNRTVLFDIGLAGPLAGFAVAVPLLILGLWLSQEVPYFSRGLTLRVLGSSVLVDGLIGLLRPIPAGRTLELNPIFFAAWFGLLITGINLLPIGQLDGGHVAYGLFGRYAHWLAYLAFFGLLVGGVVFSENWFIWAFFVIFGGLRHPPPLNDISGLNWSRKLIGLLTIILFFLLIVPVPFKALF